MGGMTGAGTGAENEFVVGDRVLVASRPVSDLDFLCLPVDGERLIAHPHVDPESVMQRLRSLQEKGGFLLDHATDVIGKTTVGVRHVSTSFQYDDLGLGV